MLTVVSQSISLVDFGKENVYIKTRVDSGSENVNTGVITLWFRNVNTFTWFGSGSEMLIHGLAHVDQKC